jgi:peptidoglycan/LPS O-acetylase OafA/YrhL
MIFSLFLILTHEQPHLIEDFKKGLLNEILFIQNYNTEQVLIGHTWSLAVEEHFYLALTLLVFILARLKILSNKVLFNGLTLFVLVSCLIMRNNVALSNPQTPFFLYLYPTHLRFDTLWIGVYIAHQYNYNQQFFKDFFAKLHWLPFCLFAFLVPLFFPLDNRFLITLGLTIIALSFGITLAALISNDKSEMILTNIFGKKIVRSIAQMGTYSYAIYLFHMTIIVVVKPFSPNLWTRISATLLVLSLIVIVGILTTEFIEKPILKWRDKYIK